MPLFRFLPISFGIEYEDVEVFRIARVLVFELTPLLLSSLVELVAIDSVDRSITSDEILGALDSSKVLGIIGTICDANRPDPGFVRHD